MNENKINEKLNENKKLNNKNIINYYLPHVIEIEQKYLNQFGIINER